MDPRAHYLGVRHHGPGSAASVLAALERLDPEEVLVELPADAAPALEWVDAPGMRPPVAILLHDAKEAARAAFYPFAEYSPEWQALQWARRRGRPVRCIDLAFGASLKLEETADSELTLAPRPDPLDEIARATGHSDGEAWWDAQVERQAGSADVFSALARLMGAAREGRELDPASERREVAREASMRQALRAALRDTQGPLAVVVGAWHVPALEAPVTAAADREALRGLRPARTEATWVPWTYGRLCSASGYRAGIASPAWYAHLWRSRELRDPAASMSRWMSNAARTLRSAGLSAATSSAIDATRLGLTLTAVRGHPIPGLEESMDAALAALCHGERGMLAVVERELVVGEALGEVDAAVPTMPLAADLERRQRAVRLKPEALERALSLDLRTDSGLARSVLLHQLRLIGVDWGELEGAGRSRGTFRENWVLAWEPELAVKLAEALRHGTTVESAASAAAVEEAREAEAVPALSQIVLGALLADVEDAARFALGELQAKAATTPDVPSILAAVVPIADVLRYGTARRMPIEELRDLVRSLAVRAHASLAYAARGLDDDEARALGELLPDYARALEVLEEEDLSEGWRRAATGCATDTKAAPFVAGRLTRLLAERGTWTSEETQRTLGRALSPAATPDDAASWLAGFLEGRSETLLVDDELYALVDAWLCDQDGAALEALLPALRRTFGSLGSTERRRLMVRSAEREPSHAAVRVAAPGRLDAALPLLLDLLGVPRSEEEASP